jgi:segregation and condensation protein B
MSNENELEKELDFEEITENQDVEVVSDVETDVSETELNQYESANIEELEFLEDSQVDSIIEGILFSSDKPVSLAALKVIFKGTQVKTDKIRRALDKLAVELAGAHRGVTLEEATGGYQLRTKVDHIKFISRNLRGRPFKLTPPSLEVLSIVAYKQPVIKSEIDEIRGVESGHLLRALMEKNLVTFGERSDLPGKPMQYITTKKFLEVFSLRSIKELPTVAMIDELLPEGIGDEQLDKKSTLSQLTDSMSEKIQSTYSEGEEELVKIADQLQQITSTTDFFEQEKVRMRHEKDLEKAKAIKEAIEFKEEVSNRDLNWLKRFEEQQNSSEVSFKEESQVAESAVFEEEPENDLDRDLAVHIKDEVEV